MNIDWSGLGEVFGIAFGATVVVVVLFSLGITAFARRQPSTDEDGTTAAPASTSAGPLVVAVLCFLVCAAVVGYGLYLIISK